MNIYQTFSSDETKKFGASLVAKLIKNKKQAALRDLGGRALVLAFEGDLGSGKTTLIQGFLKALGVRGRVNSPTFVLMKRFRVRDLNFKNVYHLDCYRLKQAKDLSDLGFKEILEEPTNLVLIEWSERVKNILPKERILIKMKHGKDENERVIRVVNGH